MMDKFFIVKIFKNEGLRYGILGDYGIGFPLEIICPLVYKETMALAWPIYAFIRVMVIRES
ncbi:MAG: hypothetical protein CL529_06835 [Aequorivita sp.]|nr:hypothetical protein [Aequorivita sp.]|tara:strand:+ start:7428 stop:7610 length:183 start_codon:yes stop_codon:yes gene_type:complete